MGANRAASDDLAAAADGRLTWRSAAVAVALALGACGGGDADPVTRGDDLFHGDAACATCHGADLRGTPMGPPLLDPIYAPDHHPDAAFHNAVRNGVQPHHWSFGPMPPLTHLDEDEVDAIVAYVRQMQERNGIE